MRKAKEIMTSDVLTVTPATTVEELATLLATKKLSGAPVVDDDNNLLGVVTESDLIDQVKKVHIPTIITLLDSVIFLESEKKMEAEIRKMTGRTVADIYSHQPVCVGPDTPLDEIASLMAAKKIHTLPVTVDNKVVGVIGKSDIIKTFLNP